MNSLVDTNMLDDEDAISGFFLDGRTALRQPTSLRAAGSSLILHSPQGSRMLHPHDVLPIHPNRTGVQFLRLKDGASCELPASPELLALLKDAKVPISKESALSMLLSGDWRASAMALAFLAGVVAAFYIWLLPILADLAAARVPLDIEQRIGQSALRQMDGLLKPSELPAKLRGEIQGRFEELTADLNGPESASIELLIRKFDGHPNAFALPGNIVVLSDELVTLVDHDLDAVSGVLAHEVGHLHHRHGMRSVVQAGALAMLSSTLIGDYSSALAAIPAGLGHLHYSRRFEAEADVYARMLMCARKVDPAKTALFFEKAKQIKGSLEGVLPSYLSSHPASGDRAAYFSRPCDDGLLAAESPN